MLSYFHDFQREPVLDESSSIEYPVKQMERDWLIISEYVRRQIQENEIVRDISIAFIGRPVTADLPLEFINALAEKDEEIKKYINKLQLLIEFLNLPTIPEESVKTDIAHIATFQPIDKFADIVMRSGAPEDIRLKLMEKFLTSSRGKGFTSQEKLMTASRYQWARDIKILALSAEILQNKPLRINEDGEISLGSGANIVLDAETDEALNLLDPTNWQRKRMLKSRVHEIEVGGSPYILKEKRTKMHYDEKRNPTERRYSSRDEFNAARALSQHSPQERGEFVISWEKPLGLVEFPDGYEFCVFQHEGSLINEEDFVERLTHEIQAHAHQFEADFNRIAVKGKQYFDHKIVMGMIKNEAMTPVYSDDHPMLTFEDYAYVKAWRTYLKSIDLLRQTAYENNYNNSDADGYAFKIIEDEQGMRVGIVGFDFEEYEKIDSQQSSEFMQIDFETKRFMESTGGNIAFGRWFDDTLITRKQRAAYLAMIDEEGLLDHEISRAGV